MGIDPGEEDGLGDQCFLVSCWLSNIRSYLTVLS